MTAGGRGVAVGTTVLVGAAGALVAAVVALADDAADDDADEADDDAGALVGSGALVGAALDEATLDATDDDEDAAGALVGGTGVAAGGTGVAVGAGAQDATTAPAVTTADNRKNSRRENARFIFLFLLWNPNKLC